MLACWVASLTSGRAPSRWPPGRLYLSTKTPTRSNHRPHEQHAFNAFSNPIPTLRNSSFSSLGSHSSSPALNQPPVPVPNMPLSLLINFLPPEQEAAWPASLTSGSPNRGLPPSFLDTLDRVDKKTIKKDDTCPICTIPYLDDKYPLVVKLKCGHKFDLECIGIWFKEHSTCPMCRSSVEKKPVVILDDEEEYDDAYS